MNILKKMTAFKMVMLVVTVMTGSALWAQPATVKEATKEMHEKFGGPCMIDNNGDFQDEQNSLAIDPNQFCINTGDDYVWIAALVKNGDYSKWWKGNNVTSNRYNWVFVPENFIKVCKGKKNISKTNMDTLSARLCRLLGLDDSERRDTIVYMKVNKKYLFRPAYNTNIETPVTSTHRGNNSSIRNGNVEIKDWMAKQQKGNNYPWTRMGYTFDWGDDNYSKWETQHGYIGVTEFIVMPNTSISKPQFVRIDSLYAQNSWRDISKQNE
jgi:hypothetical protein